MGADIFEADFADGFYAAECERIGRDIWRSAPKAFGITGIAKVSDIKFKRIFMGEPSGIN